MSGMITEASTASVSLTAIILLLLLSISEPMATLSDRVSLARPWIRLLLMKFRSLSDNCNEIFAANNGKPPISSELISWYAVLPL